jgi:tRNA nucleotidyltransferase (CCA-adding enzyme)
MAPGRGRLHAHLPLLRRAGAPARLARGRCGIKNVYMLAVLAHDFGKPATTHRAVKDGRERIVSPGHEAAGVEPARVFLERMRAPLAIGQRVIPLVQNHLFHLETITDRAIRRLARRLAPESIEGLCLVMTADSMGRPPRPAEVPENVKTLLARAHELEVRQKPPPPILQGRHLLPLGVAARPADWQYS